MMNQTMNVNVYVADVTVFADEDCYRKAYQLATPERREKVDRFRFPKGRWLSLGAELLLQYGLEQCGIFLSKSLNEKIYGYHEQGKPYLMQFPEVHFSFSHSGEMAMCAISGTEVGCDIERDSRDNRNLAERFFAKEEADLIAQQSTEEGKREMFFRLWTLKESFLKITGQGMSLPMDSFSFNFDGDRINIRQEYDERTYYFREFFVREGYKCSACGLAPLSEEGLKVVDLSEIL